MGTKRSVALRAVAASCAAVVLVGPLAGPVVAVPSAPAVPAAKPTPTGKDQLGVMASRATRLVRQPAGIYGSEYAALRAEIAVEVGERLGIAPGRLEAAWTRAPHRHQIAVMYALSQIGVPYAWGMESPGQAVDCSGLTWLAWSAAGLNIPRFSEAQYDKRLEIDKEDAFAGDFVGVDTHVRMWLGVDNATIEATTARGAQVSIANHSSAEARRWRWASPLMIEVVRSGDVRPVATPTRLMFG